MHVTVSPIDLSAVNEAHGQRMSTRSPAAGSPSMRCVPGTASGWDFHLDGQKAGDQPLNTEALVIFVKGPEIRLFLTLAKVKNRTVAPKMSKITCIPPRKRSYFRSSDLLDI